MLFPKKRTILTCSLPFHFLQLVKGDEQKIGPTSGASATRKDSAQRKEQSKRCATARRIKFEAQNADTHLSHLEDEGDSANPAEGSLSRQLSISDCWSCLLHRKTRQRPQNLAPLAKGSSSRIPPTGVRAPGNEVSESDGAKMRRINLMLGQAKTEHLTFNKELILDGMRLVAANVPVQELINTTIGNSLRKLSLKENPLSSVPPMLLTFLHALETLDLRQCKIHRLPDKWDLPQLKHLNLSHNLISEFPDEVW